MPAVDTFPDAEALIGIILRAASITGLSSRVYSSIPKAPTYPLITIKRIGGIPAERHRLDRARIQIDVWGNTKSEARDIADAARVAIFAAEGQTYDETGTEMDGFITCVEDDLGLAFIPDPATARDRYVFGLAIYLHS